MTIVEFIKEWVPPIGIMGGGFWIAFRWIYDQRIRRTKEMPALEGNYSTSATKLSESQIAITVGVVWRCASPLPVFIDTQSTRVDVFQLPRDHSIGALDIKQDLGEPFIRSHPLGDMKDFVFEPNTDNKVYAHFVLPLGAVYCFRFKVYRDTNRHGKKKFAWTREFIFDSSCSKGHKKSAMDKSNPAAS